MGFLITSLYLLFFLLTKCLSNGQWTYDGPSGRDSWNTLFPKFCDGSRQSPIDFMTSSFVLDKSLGEFTFKYYDEPVTSANLFNTGYSAQLTMKGKDRPVHISDGSLHNTYVFEQFHLHWGSNSKKGSEHTVNGVFYPAELHFVHFSKKYNTIGEALGHADGLAVLGVFFEISTEDNPKLNGLINLLAYIKFKDQYVPVNNSITLYDLMPENRRVYYRYSGSLTTPNCEEAVIWSVFDQKVKISEQQLNKFRMMSEYNQSIPVKPLVDNYREPQALNGRKVKISGKLDTGTGSDFTYSMRAH